MKSLYSSQLLRAVLALAGGLLAGCEAEPPPSQPAASVPESIPGLTPEAKVPPPLSLTFSTDSAANPAAESVPPPGAVASATPQKPAMAPPGVFYVKEHISIVHDSGVVGVAPGTRVRLIKETGPMMLVSDGKNQFEVTADQVTNDTLTAQKLMEFDQTKQSTLSEMQEQQKNALAEAELRRRLAFERHIGSVLAEKQAKEEAQASANATRPKYESPLDRGAYNNTRVWRYDIYGRSYWVDVHGRRHYVYRYYR